PDGHQDPAYLVETIQRESITTLHFVPSMLQVFVEQPGAERCASLRRVMASGEALPAELAKRFFARLPEGVELHNLYGPTEAAVDVTYHACRPGEERVPIGRPVANTRIYILDQDGNECPVGVAGELHIAGVQVGLGYLHRPDLTAERFVPDLNGARMYRTGDLARWLIDGEIEYLGRIDHQVKIRGFRIELGEIEAALARHPEVREVVVLARDQGLVAYVAPAVEADLRAFLRESLPEHMVPSGFVFLDAMPLTPNGKVDRKALARIEPERRATVSMAPRTSTEELLAAIWSGLLGVERIGVEDGFFELGGHSLLATRVISRVRDAFGVELPLRSIFETPTLAGLAARIETERPGVLAPPIRPVERTGDLPLSFAQERLWFLTQLDPGSSAYNLPMALRLTGPLDVAALAGSFRGIVQRHETLRTTFPGPVQRIASVNRFDLPVIDLRSLPERETELRRLAEEEAARPFDLVHGPVLRALLVRLDEEEHACLATLHHIAGDAWSLGVLVREMAGLYAGLPLPALPVQYADFAVWQRGWLQGEVLEAQLGYWREALAGAPTVLDLPSDRPRPAMRTSRGGDVSLVLPSASLKRLSRREGATLFMTLLAAFQALLHRIAHQDDLLVGTPVAGRNRTEIEGLVGFFVNSLVLRGRPAGRLPFRELLAQARSAALGAFAHQDLPFERLVEELEVERSLSHHPIFQVVLALQNAPMGSTEVPGLTLAPLDAAGTTAKFDLVLSFAEVGEDGLAASLEYSADLFEEPTARRLMNHFRTLLDGVAADPGLPLSDLPLLMAEEREQLAAWTGYRSDYPDVCIHELFQEQVEARPDAVAAVFEDGVCTYRELDERANRLANHLRELGVGPDVPVAVCLERSLELVIAMLAVLKAGGAYIPLDTSYPQERLAFMLEDSQAPVLVTRERWLGLLPEDRVWPVCLDRLDHDMALLAQRSRLAPASRTVPQSLALVIYTSGSTGRPKGVALTHQGVVRMTRNAGYLDLGPDDVVVQGSNTSFDAATFEIWATLLNGARLVGVNKETMLSPRDLIAQVRRDSVTVLFLTTALFNQTVRELPDAFRPLRAVLFGGEAADPAAVRQCLDGGPPERLLHLYGPAESTTFASWHLVEEVPEGASTVPIGLPIANTTLMVLDPERNLVPVGVTGDLYVGGDGLARGYLNRPDLTAERFVPDEDGRRLYRTGDLVRRRADGAIEFLGRTDFQVKIRGLRIELGEIEAALLADPEVRDAAVLAVGEGGDKRLVAYVAGRGDGLRERLAERLPSFMVPAGWVFLDALPLTPNGKVDRRALARIEPEAEAAPGFVAPRTPVEELLAGAWSELLGVANVGAGDDFFALGGHSLLATRLTSWVRDLFGVELPLRAVFEDPTLAGLAAAVEARRSGNGLRPSIPPVEPREPDSIVPLSFAQERLWFLDRMEPGNALYSIPIALRVRGVRPAILEAALAEIVRRHEVLRTTFVPGPDGSPVQAVAPDRSLSFEVSDLSGLPAEDREAEALRLFRAEAARPFDLQTGPLMRTLLVDLGDGEPWLLLNLHHIASDGWSLGVLVRELGILYQAFAEGRPSPLPELPVQYGDYSLWQRRWLSGRELESQTDYWKRALDGAATVLELPTDHPRPPVQSFRGGRRTLALPAALATAVRDLGRRRGATLFMTLLAGFDSLLHRYTGQEDILVGTPVANRLRGELEGLIGLFVNTLVLRGNFRPAAEGGPSFGDLLDRVRADALGAFDHQDVPFERLVDELRVERSLARTPLHQVVFVLQNTPV
ncbi:MAG TPA: amino acid adenylation domain-containing protein, partial [Thermoanaerobaculia bacterium]|nr:amino acid adenylation domain-containing protein [Thermoanaerobaculia bacterium]